MARSRTSGGRSSSSGRSTPSFFGSAPSRSSHTSASASSAPVRTAAPAQSRAPPPALASSHPPAPHASSASSHPPAHQQQPVAPSGGGGLLSGLAGTVMQGMAFGGGSAIAHRAVDSIAGPRTVVHEHQGVGDGQQAAQPSSGAMSAIDAGGRGQNRAVESQCGDEVLQFQRCLQDNSNSFDSCSFYFDVLSQCQKAVKENAQWK